MNLHIVEMQARSEWTNLPREDRARWLNNKLAQVSEFLVPQQQEGAVATVSADSHRLMIVFVTTSATGRSELRDILREAEASRYFAYDVFTAGVADNADVLFQPLLDLPFEQPDIEV